MFKDMSVAQPAETVPRQLPWMTGEPYALWAHVRWISRDGKKATPWSAAFGFNLEWAAGEVPAQMPAPEGLVRWAPVDGATAYEVLYPDLVPAVSFQTTTNVADEREYFTFHNSLGYATVHWRVRAIRDVGQFKSSTNGLPRRVLRTLESDLRDRQRTADQRHAEADRHGVRHLGQGRKGRHARISSPPGLRGRRRRPCSRRASTRARASTASTSSPTRTASTTSSPARSSARPPGRRARSAARCRCRET